MADWATQRKGRALWCVGKHIYKVQTVLHPAAAAFTYTNQAIDGARYKFAGRMTETSSQ